MKTCTKCNVEKDIAEFYKSSRRASGYQSACKCCLDIANKASRASKPEHYQKLHKDLRQQNRARFTLWKSTQKCCICPETVVECLDFHHLDPTTKETTISHAVEAWSWTRLQTEIQKCVIVCRNCHAKIHAGLIKL
jgi:hypothetical protein